MCILYDLESYGGLDWGENPQDGLRREIEEEMGLHVTSVSKTPSYLIVGQKKQDDIWIANVLFEVVVENLDFTPSEECVAIKFVSSEEAKTLDTFPNIQDLARMFDPLNH